MCISLGEIRFVHSVSETVILMQSYCTRSLIFPRIAWCFPAFQQVFFVPTQQVNAEALSLTPFPSPNPTTHMQNQPPLWPCDLVFDVICKHAEYTNIASRTHVNPATSAALTSTKPMCKHQTESARPRHAKFSALFQLAPPPRPLARTH